MIERIIISGFGGQGVLSAGLMLAESAVHIGLEATFMPSYGIEMRGGTANCHVIISDKKIGSPIISEADSLIAFNEQSILKFAARVRDKGLIMLNSCVVQKDYDFPGRKVVMVPMESMAIDSLGNQKMANVIMIGRFIREKAFITLDELKRVINEKFLKKGEKVVNLNYQALEIGYQLQ
jgi:2-oxoglutarate ferredoxin oxidoreductase subunit gamma